MASQRLAVTGVFGYGVWPRSKRLNAEQERVLASRAAADDPEARQTLIEANLWLVARVAHRYLRSGVPLGDLLQEGSLGLIQAVDRYDWRRGVPFGPYARLWISHAIRRAVPLLRHSIRVPREVLRDRARRAETAADEGPALEPVPLDGLGPDAETDLADLLPDLHAPDPERALLAAARRQEVHAWVGGLAEREQQVLAGRFGLAGETEQSLAELGRRLGLSRQRVQQIEARALDRLRASAAAAPDGDLVPAETVP